MAVTERLGWCWAPWVQPVVERELRRRDVRPRVRERMEMVKAAVLGQNLGEIVRWSGRSPRRVVHWLRQFATGGVAAVADAPRPGRPVRATVAYLTALGHAIAVGPRALGLSYDVWTSVRLSAYLAEQTGVRLAPSWLRSLLKRQGYVTGRPKHTLHHLQDAEEVAACQAALAVAEKKGGSGAGAL